jgi:hypothetical protein
MFQRHSDALVVEPLEYLFRRHEHSWSAGLEDLHEHFYGHGCCQRAEKYGGALFLQLSVSPLLGGTRDIGAEVEPVPFAQGFASDTLGASVAEQGVLGPSAQYGFKFLMCSAVFGLIDEFRHSRLQCPAERVNLTSQATRSSNQTIEGAGKFPGVASGRSRAGR